MLTVLSVGIVWDPYFSLASWVDNTNAQGDTGCGHLLQHAARLPGCQAEGQMRLQGVRAEHEANFQVPQQGKGGGAQRRGTLPSQPWEAFPLSKPPCLLLHPVSQPSSRWPTQESWLERAEATSQRLRWWSAHGPLQPHWPPVPEAPSSGWHL